MLPASFRYFCYTILLTGLILLNSCADKTATKITVPSEFLEYVTGYTSGKISSGGEIAVSFAKPVPQSNQLTSGLFAFSPNIAGETKWVSEQTAVFVPSRKLENDRSYMATVQLGKLFEIKEDQKVFSFEVSTIRQDIEVEVGALETAPGSSGMQLKGTVYTADAADLSALKKAVKAEHNGKQKEIEWKSGSSKQTHFFQINEIERGEGDSELTVQWNGKPIGAKAEGRKVIPVAAKGTFELMDLTVFRDENPRVELSFSDPISARQNLTGLITIDNSDDVNTIIHQNKITVTPRRHINEPQKLRIEPSIVNTDGKKLGVHIEREIQFFQPKPEVVLLGKGTIIPQSKELLFPFKAVSLGAVDVQVTRIFESNIGQFLQDFDLGDADSWNIRQVGRPVFGAAVPLSDLGRVDAGKWNNYALDLSEIISPEPGALYQVEIGFRKIHSLYPCSENDMAAINEVQNWEYEPEEEEQYWQRYDNQRYPPNYNWRERDNACDVSYYYSGRDVSRNVMASDLGMVAKRADEKAITVFITDLLTAQPKSGVKVTAYDYQQQIISEGISDAQGKTDISTEREPFYVIATSGKQKGYLKVNDGNALSVSDFDVSGARIQQGIKGFLYGERGVWRPGDSLFVTLMLEDENNNIPENHPVTFELRNPSGQVVERKTQHGGLNNMYVFKTKTEKQARTGNWRVHAKVGGLEFTKSLKIETVKPNRLKVEVDYKKEQITAATRQLEATISSRWLHGATAAGLKADVEMALRAVPIYFSDYSGFSFNDATVSFSSTPSFIFDGKLNAQGEADFSHRFNRMSEGPGKIRVNLKTRVFEPSGSFSVGSSSTNYFPFRTLVGIKAPDFDSKSYEEWLDPEKSHRFELVSVDANGAPVSGKKLNVEVYNIRWRWWWERGTEDLSNYFERRNVEKVLSGEVVTNADGKAKMDITLPDEQRGGRYLVRVKDEQGGHSASRIVYYSWYGGREESTSPARLAITTNKDEYEVGENIELNIPSAEGSRILVSLETGSRVLSTFWVDGEKKETKVNIPAGKTMSPNVYAHVMHLQPHGQQKNDLPLRMYGIIPITVKDPTTKLAPAVDLPQELRPESTAKIRVSEENGKAMTYTLAMVDEGLLDLTNFRTPEPHTHFYAREALGVKTWDMFQYVSDAFAGNLSRIMAIGGDGEAEGVDPLEEVNRFEPMVRFEGPFELKTGAVNEHSISMPNYVGSVRTMVIASNDDAYGQAQKTTPVRKPVMVLATLPRVLGPGEKVNLPVSVFAMREDIKQVAVRVETGDLLEVNGDQSATLHFDEAGDEIITFELKTKSKIGIAKVRVEASGGGEKAYHEIEIAVRNPNTPFVDVRSEVITEGESWKETFEPQGMPGTNTATLEISRIPPIDFGKRLRFLTRFPHGGVEQVTSSVFPQLYAPQVMELPDAKKAKMQKKVDDGIQKMQKYLTYTGGLSYWPGEEDPNSWGTNYGYHFLLEAEDKGYYVPSNLLQKINAFQKQRARNWSSNQDYRYSDLIQAYRLYTLARAQTPELGAMNRLRNQEKLSVQASWRLAAAYALAGQQEAAEELVQNISAEVKSYQELAYSYGSALRDRAMILETLVLLDQEKDAAVLMRDISEELSSRQWYSTQTTAYSLVAVSKFLVKFSSSEDIQAGILLNKKQIGKIDSRALIVEIPIQPHEFEANKFEVNNNSSGTLFARLTLEGKPLLGDSISTSNGLKQQVRFTNLDGKTISPNKLEQGTDFIAEVTVTNPGLRGDYNELALTQIFPSGWEIRNTRMDDVSFSKPTSSFSYQDIRDDRVYTYFDLAPNQTKRFRIQLNAGYAGKFYYPAVTTQAMYDKSISARTTGKWIEVKAR